LIILSGNPKSPVRQLVLRSRRVHLTVKDMESTPVNFTALVNCVEASLVLVDWQAGREFTHLR
jgi:hypothetical protein